MLRRCLSVRKLGLGACRRVFEIGGDELLEWLRRRGRGMVELDLWQCLQSVEQLGAVFEELLRGKVFGLLKIDCDGLKGEGGGEGGGGVNNAVEKVAKFIEAVEEKGKGEKIRLRIRMRGVSEALKNEICRQEIESSFLF